MINFRKRPIIIAAIIILVVGIAGGYFYFGRSKVAPYDFIVAKKQNLIQEVSLTGNVKPGKTIELAFEKTGTVSTIFVEVGQVVKSGQLLARLASQDAQKEVRDAEVDLENERIAFEKIKLEYEQLRRGDKLQESYEEGLDILASLYNEYQDILDDLEDLFFDSNLSGSRETNIQYYVDYTKELWVVPRIAKLYEEIIVLYEKGFSDYQASQRGSGQAREQAIQSGYELTLHTAEMIKVGRDAIRSFQDIVLKDTVRHSKATIIDGHILSLKDYSKSMNEYVADLLATISAINSEQDAKENYPLTIASQELKVKQKENSLKDARDDLLKYSIVAPINAVLSKRDISIGEIASANTALFVIISASDYEIEAKVPEADIAKIQVGNEATITLDAYGRDEIFKATVVKIDPAETVVEGVATYKVVLQFIKDEERVKSGMTANIDIASASRENVIAVSQRSLIRKDGGNFVRILDGQDVREVAVEIGLRSSDGNIEIIKGVNEGDKVITFSQE